MTSFRMQFENIGRGLLLEAFRSEGEFDVSRKRGGKIRKGENKKGGK